MLLIVGLFLYVDQNQELVVARALKSFNQSIPGEIQIDSSQPEFFENFPYISIDLRGLRLFEDKSKGTPIAQVDDFYLGFNLWNLLQGDYTVKKIKISGGYLHAVKDLDQNLNLMKALVKADESDTLASESMEFDLASFQMGDFFASYLDLGDSLETDLQVEKLTASISFRDSVYRVGLDTRMDLDVLSKGLPTFLSQKKTGLKLDLVYDSESRELQVNKSQLELEEADFELAGKVAVLDAGMDLNLKVEGRKPDFNLLGAFLPKELADGLKQYQNQGDVFFRGSILGKAGEGEMPAITIEFGCEDAFFLKTANAQKLDELRFTGFFTNGAERSLRSSEFHLQNFKAKPGKGDFQANLIIKNFEDPHVKINMLAALDLDFVGEFFDLEGFEGISGEIKLSMDFDELQDVSMDRADLIQLKESVQSELILSNLSFSLPGLAKPIKKMDVRAILKDGALSLERFDMGIGSSDLSLSGSLSDFPAIFHRLDEPVEAKLKLNSTLFDLKDVLGDSSSLEIVHDLSVSLSFDAIAKDLFGFDYLPKGNFLIDDLYMKLEKFPHVLHDFHADVLIGANDLSIRDFKGEVDQTDFLFTGKVENYRKWFREELSGKSSFTLDLISRQIRVNDLLTYDGVNYLPASYRDETLQNLSLKAKIDLNYQNGLQSMDLNLEQFKGKLSLHPLKLESFSGRVHWENGWLDVRDFGGKMGESDFRVDLLYKKEKDSTEKKNEFRLRAKALDLDALLGFEGFEKDTNHQEAFNIFSLPFSEMRFAAEIGKLKYHTYWLEKIRLQARTDPGHMLYLDSLSMNVADGSLGMKGYFNGSDPENIYFYSDLKAEKMDIDRLLFKVENFGQDYLINENLKGRISGNISSKFKVYPDLTPILDQSEAKMELRVYDGSLINFAPMQAMSSYFADKNLNRVRFDTLSNTFELKNGTLFIPKMDINSSLGFIELSGKQGLDLTMDYLISVPLGMVTQVGFRALFGGRNRNEIDPYQEDAIVSRAEDRRVRFVNLRMTGTPDNYDIKLGRK
ncbi:AsmA-like C-terminal region-containing protein [Algoriphagus confluentis]|uniref:AsmA-like C-terminal domain-containing protein n=1 Tax=Algoriphagus confluentis TaxID=1697556 RepID=A0ABQ6PTI8_9BACT|nr:hypothetical protein Aconfl_35400 [Algoriphagus confluentis]